MVSGMHKSRTFRRVKRKTPGGKVVLHHVLRKPKKAHCGSCGDVLKGVARERPIKMQNMPKTMKRPERPFGGVLCSKCLRQQIKDKVRK
jgi:large subunit ribosomal protein L34e